MNDITIITPKSLDEARALSTTLAKSHLLPDALRGKEPEILMTIMTGSELGLAPMQSIRAIEVIKGKPTLKAETMTALVRARRDVCEYLRLTVSTPTIATFETKRVGDPSPTTMSFTAEDAKAAGLLGNDNYKRFPAAMLRARCASAICKAVYSDLLLGVYDPEELAPERPVEKDITPSTPPHFNSVDDVAFAMTSPAPHPDYDGNGAPVTERAKLAVSIAEAQELKHLEVLTGRISALKTSDPKAYAELRTAWGARRDELKGPPPAPTPPPPALPEPGSEG